MANEFSKSNIANIHAELTPHVSTPVREREKR